jgi:hypothetical protein
MKIKQILWVLSPFILHRRSKFSPARLEKIRSHIPTEAESGKLRKEINTLRSHLEEILKHPGKHVLIHGDDIIGYFDSHSVAETKAYRRFGTEASFMVQEIDELTRPLVEFPFGRVASLAEA